MEKDLCCEAGLLCRVCIEQKWEQQKFCKYAKPHSSQKRCTYYREEYNGWCDRPCFETKGAKE
jgi:hypothetical protein